MRTIIVIFTERKVSLNEIPSYKKYKINFWNVWGSRFFARRVYMWS